ncbi:MAG: transglycosylase SLT domain-containing protein, partial [Bryobacteraceae bacterium]
NRKMTPTKAQVIDFLQDVAPEYGLDPAMVIRQCQTESNFDQSAVSRCGAIGLLQLMPATADELKVNPRDWHANLCGGMKYLARMTAMFGDPAKGLAAYNCGPGRLSTILREHGDDWREHLPAETKGYLEKILSK